MGRRRRSDRDDENFQGKDDLRAVYVNGENRILPRGHWIDPVEPKRSWEEENEAKDGDEQGWHEDHERSFPKLMTLQALFTHVLHW